MAEDRFVQLADFYTEASGDRVRVELDRQTGEVEIFVIEHQIRYNADDLDRLQRALTEGRKHALCTTS
jgi:hypothetical protein